MRIRILLAVICLGLSAQALALDLEEQKQFDIPAQKLTTALVAFSRQAGTPVVSATVVVDQFASPAVSGRMSLKQALSALLEGTGLVVKVTDSGAIAVSAADPKISAERDPPPIEEVVVTGSHIRGVAPTSPVTIVSRTQIEDAGYSQVADFVRNLPANSSTGRGRTIMSGTAGGSTYGSGAPMMNLRGIGPDATLVLLNGHRIAGDDTSLAPDISLIPLAALERVEILTDGASALYGSDAVAGVANFILRNDFEGVEASARFGTATHGGGFEQTYNLAGGNTWQGGHLLAGGEFLHQGPIGASERDFTSQMAPENSLLDELEKTSFFISGAQNIDGALSVHLDSLYTRRTDELAIRTRPTSALIQSRTDAWSYLIAPGIKWQLPAKWTVSLDATLSRSADSEHSLYPASGLQYQYDFTNSTRTVEVNASGPALRLPSGELQLALGGGYREDESLATSLNGGDYRGGRNVRYFFAEISAPLVTPDATRAGLNELDFNVAGRTEDYSTFGRSINPKLGLRYVPFAGLGIRGTWGKSFKTPSFFQTAYPSSLSLLDAVLFGATAPGTVLFSNGGNPDLSPEKSRSWTAGVDWSPASHRSLKLAATYFNIDYTDRVVSPFATSGDALSNPIYASFIFANPSLAQQGAIVAAADRFDNYSSSPTYDPSQVLAYIDDRNVNATQEKIDGVDVSANETFPTAIGAFNVSASATYLTRDRTLIPTVPASTISGSLFYPSKLRARTSIGWVRQGVSANAIVNYISSENDPNVTPNARIASWTTLDLNVAYQLLDASGPWSGFQASLSVINALDKDPPFARGAAFQTTGLYFDSANASAIGRFVAASVRKRF